MESPWKQTFSSVFVILYVNNVYVYSQSLPPEQTITIYSEYGDSGYVPNGIYSDGYPPGRAFPDAIVQSRGPTDTTGTGTYIQRSSMPEISQLMYSFPCPNLIRPIGISTPPPVLSVAPVPQQVFNAPTVPRTPNNLPPPPTIVPATYVGTNAQLIPSPPTAPFCQNSEIQPTIHIIANPNNFQSQGAPITANFIPNPGSIVSCPQKLPPPTLYISGLPNSNIVTYNQHSPMIPPVNQYIPNTNPIVPCPQTPPSIPPTQQFIPGIPISQIFHTPPQNLYVQNVNDRCSIPYNSISLESTPSQGLGVQFIPDPGLSTSFTPIEILPPAIPPYRDPQFAPQQFYPNRNTVPPFLPSQSYPLIPQFIPCNSISPPIIFPPLTTCNSASFPQGSANPPIFPKQEVFLPPNHYEPYTTNLVIPMVLPPEHVQLPITDEDNSLPINLQINVPAVNVPPPYITIITTVPPNPPPAIVEPSDSDSVPYPLGNFIPFPTYSPPPIIVKGSKSKCKKWIPILIALFANRDCSDGCNGGCCCSCGNNIPIPFPIAIPTNNPIVIDS